MDYLSQQNEYNERLNWKMTLGEFYKTELAKSGRASPNLKSWVVITASQKPWFLFKNNHKNGETRTQIRNKK